MQFETSVAGRTAVFPTATSVLASSASLAGDLAAGQHVFAECAGCHSTIPGQNKIGPSSAGIIAPKSGTVAGYEYSSAMESANITWDNPTLDKFPASPAGFVHGTKMFISVSSRAERQNVIAYLDT